MISYICLHSLILIYITSNVKSQAPSRDCLGTAACELYGELQNTCQYPELPIDNFPKECTSFTYCCVAVENNQMTDTRASLHGIQDYLDNILRTNISLYVYYYHKNHEEWCKDTNSNNTAGQTIEMDNLQSFLSNHTLVKGVIFTYLYDNEDNSTGCHDYSQNLKTFINLMHTRFPQLGVGLNVMAKRQKQNYQSQTLPWLDFSILDSSVDFYIFDLDELNHCTDEFTKTTAYPLYGESEWTVDKMRNSMVQMGASPSKLHIVYTIFGDLKNSKQNACNSFPKYYCHHTADAKQSLCLDTTQELVAKGTYAKVNTAGFVVNNIDLDDFSCDCQCGRPFPRFQAILSGYNGSPSPAPCAASDRT